MPLDGRQTLSAGVRVCVPIADGHRISAASRSSICFLLSLPGGNVPSLLAAVLIFP